MNDFTLVAETDKYTVVGSYEPEKKNSLLYESEAALEKRFIAILEGQGYKCLNIKTAIIASHMEGVDKVLFVVDRSDLDALFAEEKLKPDETVAFFEGSLHDDFLKTTGTDIDLILPPMSRFGGGNREEKKQSVIAKLQTLFERYKGLVG